jgi:uncharacterized membrane protein YfcA
LYHSGSWILAPEFYRENKMILKGTVVNIAAVIVGCVIGKSLGRFIPERMRRTVMMGLGLAVLLIGFQLAIHSRATGWRHRGSAIHRGAPGQYRP